ncbi:MAG: ABC-F family ATP-binding cassette domain-containing protein [Phycisphaerae bacterium]|jgi:ATP-binding cassette subfamily F protein 3
MSLIVGESISKSWSDKDVLKNVSFTLAPNERVGLIGPNGEGKTTLLRIIAGLEAPTEGRLSRRTGLRLGYLPQDTPSLEGSTLRSAMLEVFADLARIEGEMHALSEQMGAGDDPRLLARYGELQHAFEDRGGYGYAQKIEAVLSGLGFARELWDAQLSHLSGGQRTLAYLAKLLLEESDVLLLDEPTNHLDLAATEWLEKWLAEFHGAVIVISHDRHFLDHVTHWTWEISFAALEVYRGGYSEYLTKRAERFKERQRRYEAQQEYIEETREFIRRFIAGQRSKEAQGRRTRLERFLKTEAMPRPREHPRISVRLHAAARTGDFVLNLNGLKVGYSPGRPLVSVEKLDIQRGQRVVIVGGNGCGKTTLLKTIMGTLKPLATTEAATGAHGRASAPVRWGANVQWGYISQTHAELDPTMTAVDAVRQNDPAMTEGAARSLLGSLLLSEQDAFKKISELSGGQRSRVVLARLVLQRANVLILDEPTNHLDITSQEVLQDVLSEFEGTVICVSHDRYFIQALATDIWAVNEGTIAPLRGNWATYVQWRQQCLGVVAADVAETAAEQAKRERKEDFSDRKRRANEIRTLHRRLATVEESIHKLETLLKAINDQMSDTDAPDYAQRIGELAEQYGSTDTQIQAMLKEWEELNLAIEHAGGE